MRVRNCISTYHRLISALYTEDIILSAHQADYSSFHTTLNLTQLYILNLFKLFNSTKPVSTSPLQAAFASL